MSTYEPSEDESSLQTDSYELRASQEEFYLEETEEDLRMILECEITTSQLPEQSLPDSETEIEELLTGDSDDPPLSEDQVQDELRRF